jgi:signal peptidase I
MYQDPLPMHPTNGPPESHVGSGKKSSRWRGVLSTISILIAAPVMALLLTAFIFQSYEVDGRRMQTTLQDKDRLIVWKAPRTLAKLTHQLYIPHRYDIVIFNKTGLPEAGGQNKKQLIKRVVGLPGERVVVKEGQVTIYNKDHPEGFNPDSNQPFTQNIFKPTQGNVDITVAEGEVFVCGDNRGDSTDSRSFGPIAANDIIGRLVVRIFPLNSFKSYL